LDDYFNRNFNIEVKIEGIIKLFDRTCFFVGLFFEHFLARDKALVADFIKKKAEKIF
jgi:hypothetical protein